jgi:hypothetical protein
MTDARIRVAMQPGSRAGERAVSFTVPREVTLTVDEHDLEGDLLRVSVVSEDAGRVTVRLPSPTLMGSFTIALDRADVFPVTSGAAAPAPDDGDPELDALDEAWRDILHTREDDPTDGRPLLTLLLAAVAGGPYEGAEADPPAVAVLRAVRATVEGWAHGHSGRTLFASVAFADLHLLTCRLNVAIAIVKRSPGGIR